MLIEPLQSITVKLPEGVKTLEPGKTYNLPYPQAEKLLSLAPERVRIIEPTIRIGDFISYQVPGDETEGPFEVIEVSPDTHKGGGWALVSKPTTLAWVHSRIVNAVIPKDQRPNASQSGYGGRH